MKQKTSSASDDAACCASFERECLGMPYTPTKEEIRLRELVEEYHGRTEEYDRKVCTGPIHNGSIMPSDGLEMASINRNARRVRDVLWEEVRTLGFDRQQWMEAISEAALRIRHNAAPPRPATPSALPSTACSIFDRECCPRCGGKSGFSYLLTIRGTQLQPWKNGEGEPYFESQGHATKHGAYRCDDCGKVIKSND